MMLVGLSRRYALPRERERREIYPFTYSLVHSFTKSNHQACPELVEGAQGMRRDANRVSFLISTDVKALTRLKHDSGKGTMPP